MQLKMHLLVADLDDTQLHQLRNELDVEFRYRDLAIPPVDVKLLKLADFERHLTAMLNEAKERRVTLPTDKVALPPLSDAEMALIETGRHIAAIKHFRDRYSADFKQSVGLKDAKDHCDKYRAELQLKGQNATLVNVANIPSLPIKGRYDY